MIFKGERLEVLKTNLLDIHGFLQKESFLGTLGGLVQQLYYIVDDIVNRFPAGLKTYMEKKVENLDEDYFTRPNNLRELIMAEHFMPFLMSYIKDLKCDSIDLCLHPLCAKFLDNAECPHDDLSGLTDEQLIAFKDLFLKNKPKDMRKLSKQLDTLLDQLIDILAKRIPVENVHVKIDSIHHKVRLVTLAEGMVEEDYEEIIEKVAEDGTKTTETIKHAKNVDFQALILMKVPQHEVEVEKNVSEGGDMEAEKVEPMEMTAVEYEMEDEDQQGQAISVVSVGAPHLGDKPVFSINQYASQSYREHFLGFIKTTYPEFFDDNKDWDHIIGDTQKQAEKDIGAYIDENCQKYVQPCMEFDVHAPDL